MKIVRTVADLRAELRPYRADGSVGLVPTMGALHDGHLQLARRAKAENDVVVMSIFVNPTQFNDPADLAAYPRDERKDAELAESAGVDLLFAPGVHEVYPPGFATTVVPKTPKRRSRCTASASSLSGTSIHAAMARNARPTIQRSTSGPSACMTQPPTAPAAAWLASVATRMPAMMGSGRRNLAASTIASSWVLSPISPRATTPVETRKACNRSAPRAA